MLYRFDWFIHRDAAVFITTSTIATPTHHDTSIEPVHPLPLVRYRMAMRADRHQRSAVPLLCIWEDVMHLSADAHVLEEMLGRGTQYATVDELFPNGIQRLAVRQRFASFAAGLLDVDHHLPRPPSKAARGIA